METQRIKMYIEDWYGKESGNCEFICGNYGQRTGKYIP